MKNEELQDAITMANAMVKATGQDSPRFALLLDHFHALLREQQRRAVATPTLAPSLPVWVQPMPVQQPT